MKGLILYHSKYGACEEIAAFISKEIIDVDDCFNIDHFHGNIETYDFIIIGFSVYAGMLSKQCLTFIKENEKILLKKPLYLFYSGINKESDNVEKVYTENLPTSIKEHATYYDCLGGRLNFPKMKFIEKSLIKMINKKANMVEKSQYHSNVNLIDYERINTFIREIQSNNR